MTVEATGPSRRAVVVTAAALAGAGTFPARATARGAEALLRSGTLDVRVDTAFPRIVSYTDRATGAVLHGQEDPVTSLLVDETEHTPDVTVSLTADRAAYTLTLPAGTRIDVEIRVHGSRVDWRVTRIAEAPALRVGTLRVPGLAFLSVRSTQPGAELLAARLQLDAAKSGDTHI
ncbi:hypothetical protein K6I33_005597, partial [Streptomyces sp. UNOB3_S3]|nr:hypothetical protein [Streptomyces sp. UNOB3_S3]